MTAVSASAALKRSAALAALAERPLEPRELQSALDVSRSTAHRVATALAEQGLVERTDGTLALTPLGEVVADEVRAFERRVDLAGRLQPVVAATGDGDDPVDPGHFADARVTEPTQSDAFRPVERFMELVRETTTLRGLDPATINPLHLDELNDAIVDGMETAAIFRRSVANDLVENHPERARAAFESGNLTLYTLADVPFGLTLCDDRVGVAVYDDRGMLACYVDTDDERAMAWGERVYETYRERADRFDWSAAGPE